MTRDTTLLTRRHLVIVTAASLPLVLAGCGVDRDPPTAQPSMYRNIAEGNPLDTAAAASMISGYRQNNGLGAVALEPGLNRMAEEQARAMASADRMDHTINGRTFKTRMDASPVPLSSAVENIGAGYLTLAQAFSGWRDSPSHRANMLNRNATIMGIAAATNPRSKYRVFWSLILAQPDTRRS
jgi:uncharacterized protein YkwD